MKIDWTKDDPNGWYTKYQAKIEAELINLESFIGKEIESVQFRAAPTEFHMGGYIIAFTDGTKLLVAPINDEQADKMAANKS